MPNDNDLISRKGLLLSLPLFNPDQNGYPLNGGIQYARAMIEAAPTMNAVILPCKPGDIVFYMNRYRHKVWPMKITTVEINSQGINEYGCWCDVPESYTPICFPPFAIGKTVFFTREEAEAALAKMNGGADNA